MVTVNVSGSQTYGSHSTTLTYTTTPPDVAVTGTLRCTKVSTGATITSTLKAQAYTVDGTSCSGLSTTANYSLSYVGASGGFSVSKSHLTVTATSVTRPYGAGNPAFSYKVSGFANTETTSVVSGSASCITTATTKSAVGTYPITCTTGSLSAANYTFTFVKGTLTVTPVTLTVTAKSTTKAYGAALPTFTDTVTGFVAGDHATVVTGTASCTTLASSSSPVGTYKINCTKGSLSAHNYTFTFKSGTLKVTPATLTVTAKSTSRLYNTANPTFGYTVTGFVAGDHSTVVSGKASCSTTATKTSPAGTYPITCIQGTLAASNYTFTFKPGNLAITLAPPTITSVARTSGPVSGGTQVTITGTHFTTVVNVKFGTTAAPAFTVKSSTQLVATAPAHAAGTVRISVTTTSGTTPATSVDIYKYVLPGAGRGRGLAGQRPGGRWHVVDGERQRALRGHDGLLRHNQGDDDTLGQRRGYPAHREEPGRAPREPRSTCRW